MRYKYKQLIPAVVLILCSLRTIESLVDRANDEPGFAFTLKHYGASGMVAATLVTFFTARPLYKYLLSLTLGLGLVNIINFIPDEVRTGFGLGSLTVYFSPVVFLVGLLTYILNRSQANKVLFA